jgi:hypothetical protein
MELQWKIRQSGLWRAGSEPYSEPEVSLEAGDEDLCLIDADGFVISPETASKYCQSDHDQCVLAEFEVWAGKRKGLCKICGDLPVEVDTTDGGLDQSTIKTECVHGVLVVQYHLVGDELPSRPVSYRDV